MRTHSVFAMVVAFVCLPALLDIFQVDSIYQAFVLGVVLHSILNASFKP